MRAFSASRRRAIAKISGEQQGQISAFLKDEKALAVT